MPAGRPSKLTPEITEALCEALRTGLTYEDACLSTGIGVETFRRWRVLGESRAVRAIRRILGCCRARDG